MHKVSCLTPCLFNISAGIYIKLYLKNHISGLSDSVLAMLPIHVWNVFCIIVVGVAYVVVTKPLGAIGQITDTP